jgi:16S rRNA (guanine966-N2)-methyltransferase
MRITSGILKGRTFKVPKTGVRPTTERVREAIFSSLAAHVPNARVLDLFAGAGSLGLESWSRGADCVTAVEKNLTYWKNLEQNFQRLGQDPDLGNWQIVCEDVYTYLKRPVESFDLVFADPPYDEIDVSRLLEALGNVLTPKGFLVFEMHKRDTYTLPLNWSLIREKKYGLTKVIFLERTV